VVGQQGVAWEGGEAAAAVRQHLAHCGSTPLQVDNALLLAAIEIADAYKVREDVRIVLDLHVQVCGRR